MAGTSPNTAFTLRIAVVPLGPHRGFSGKWSQTDNPALPNRVAAGSMDLKAIRRREHMNVICNSSTASQT
ncbi:hypothetical protein J53TS2_29650 [Paenibacillus sp. J53TS2]|nr:hypothetical protein J53TS2_29650 [Paenibacillus sp. J53TS2]